MPANVALLTLVDQLFMLSGMDKAAAACIAESTGWLSRQPEEFRAEVIRRSHLRRFEAGEIFTMLAIRQAACTGWSRAC